MTKKKSQYDAIADMYDELFIDENSLKENEEVGEMLRPLKGTVLDIGCGTGLLTEIMPIEPDMYMGVDPSKKMLDKFKAKHPLFRNLICASYDGTVVDCNGFDNVISLFGSPSYLSNMSLLRISKYKGRLFLMFYKEGYHPVTYEMCNVEFKHKVHSKKVLQSLFGSENVKDYNNYLIVSR